MYPGVATSRGQDTLARHADELAVTTPPKIRPAVSPNFTSIRGILQLSLWWQLLRVFLGDRLTFRLDDPNGCKQKIAEELT